MRHLFLIGILLVVGCSQSAFAQAPGQIDYSTIHMGADAPTNYVKNPSGIKNTAGVATSNATIARDVTGSSDLLDGKSSLVCDASSQNGYCEWQTNTINEGDKTGNCEARATFKGDATLYKLQVYDGTNVVTSSPVLTNASDWFTVMVPYPCGSTRTVRLTQTEAGTGAAVNIGRVRWGKATNLGYISPITDWETYTCSGALSTNVTYACKKRRVGDSLEVEGRILFSGANTQGIITVQIPSGLTIDSTKISDTTNVRTTFGTARIYDSSTDQGYDSQALYNSSTNALRFARGDTTAGHIADTSSNRPITFASGDYVVFNFKVPISGWGTQQAISENQSPWYVYATIGGANPSLGTSAVTSFAEITNGSLSMLPFDYSAPAGIMCASGNSPATPTTSTSTCSAGNESVGITFTPPKEGVYKVCFYGSNFTEVNNGTIAPIFEIKRTNLTSTTIVTSGRVRQQSGTGDAAGGSTFTPVSQCTLMILPATQVGLRLMYEQQVVGTVSSSSLVMDEDGNYGSRNGVWTVEPAVLSSPAPLLTGSVTSNSTGLERVERAELNCDSGSAILSQSGSWISSIGNVASGACSVTLASGIFASAPSCQLTVKQALGTFVVGPQVNVTSATAVSIGCSFLNNGSSTVNACTTTDYYLHCQGPRGN